MSLMDENMTNKNQVAAEADTDCSECLTCPARAHTFYSTIPEERIAIIAGLRREQITLPARNIFHHEGEVPDTVYSLKEGWAFRYTILEDGRRQILEFLLPGAATTFPAGPGEELHFSVQALTAVTLCAFNRSEIEEIQADRPEIAARLHDIYAKRARARDARITDLGRRPAIERVTRFMMELRIRLAEHGLVDSAQVPFPLRQQHVADALGLTTIHVSRVMSQLRQNNVLSIKRGVLTIHDETKFRQVASFRE